MLRLRPMYLRVVHTLRRVWSRIREWCGDAAYERYLRAVNEPEAKGKLSAEEFYVEQLQRRYSQPNKCC